MESVIIGMIVCAVLTGASLIFLGGLRIIIFLITKMLGAQKVTAAVAEYEGTDKNGYLMYLNINHERMPEKVWIPENVKFKKGKPEIEVGGSIDVYWVPGKKTAVRADSLKRNLICMIGGVAAIALGFVIGWIFMAIT